MNKSEFASAIAEKTGLSKKKAAETVEAVLSILNEQMTKGEAVTFIGFGTFGVKNVPERERKNPRDGSTMVIEAHRSPFFKPGKSLKDSVR